MKASISDEDKQSKVEALKQRLSGEKQIQSDNPQVEMTKLKLDAILQLANGNNDQFSELTKNSVMDETLLYSLAKTYATHPLRGLEGRLMARNITNIDGSLIEIEISTYRAFLEEFLVRRHCMNRGRVEEYLKALKNITPTHQEEQNKPESMLRRLG
jgi:hypothetical protein